MRCPEPELFSQTKAAGLPDLLEESRSLWDHLAAAKKPIYLYGMGDGADKILRELSRRQIRPAGVFASDQFVRGHSFAGFPVERYSQVQSRHGRDFIALLAFAVNYEPMLSTLTRMEEECEFYAPDVPVASGGEGVPEWEVFDRAYLWAHLGELEMVWDHLADALSRRVFLDTLNYKLSGKMGYLRRCETPRETVWVELLRPSDEEIYLDGGAYNGDTVLEFLRHTGGKSGGILALEPDPKNYAKLVRNLETENVPADCRNLGLWWEEGFLPFKGGKGGRNPLLAREGNRTVRVDTVDHLLDGKPLTLLKLDIEGAEQQALLGAAETLRQHKPKLILSAYHRNEDLFSLPLLALRFRPDYRLYLRHHPYIPAWDTNYYLL